MGSGPALAPLARLQSPPRSLVAAGITHPKRWQAGQLPMERGQVVVAHRQVLLGQDEGAGTQWGVYGVSTCHHHCTIRGPSATQAQSTSKRPPAHTPHLPEAFTCHHRSRSALSTCPAPRAPTLPTDTPYQLLQGSQLLWQVTEAGAVQLQPPKTGHGLDILREVASLRGLMVRLVWERNVPALPPSMAPECPWEPLGSNRANFTRCVTLDKALCHSEPQFLTIKRADKSPL